MSKKDKVFSILDIPNFKKLLGNLLDTSYLPDNDDLGSIRIKNMSKIYLDWYKVILPDKDDEVLLGLAKIKSAKVIYGHTYSLDMENAIEALDNMLETEILSR